MPAVERPLIDKPLGHDAPEIVRNRYPTSGKLEIIRTVEASHLPIRQTLRMLGSPSSTYYDWYIRWSEGGIDALAVRSPRPGSVWNRIPDKVREDVVDFALEHEDLTPRELAVKYIDERHYFVSECKRPA